MANKSEVHSLLEEIGLNPKEYKVFVALLKGGSLSARAIAEETGITRTHVYTIAEDLLKKGLLTESEVRGVKRYDALTHAELVGYLSRKRNELELLEKRLEQASGLFNALHAKNAQKTRVRFYEGLEGIKSVYEEVRTDLEKTPGRKELITFWPTESLERAYPGFFEKQVYFNMPALIKRDIMYECETTSKYVEMYRTSPTTHSYRIWPKEMGEFPTDVEVWGNKVSFTDVRNNPSGIVIENDAVADSMRMWFEQIWESLPIHTAVRF